MGVTIDIHALDWQKLSGFHSNGSLKKPEFHDSEECEALWEGAPNFYELVGIDNYRTYHAVLDDASFYPLFEFEGKDDFLLFTKSLLDEQIKSDLNDGLPSHYAVIRPRTGQATRRSSFRFRP